MHFLPFYQLSCWLRLPKLILMRATFVSTKETSTITTEKSALQRIRDLACLVFGIIHIGACIWFYIGSRYQVGHYLHTTKTAQMTKLLYSTGIQILQSAGTTLIPFLSIFPTQTTKKKWGLSPVLLSLKNM